MTNNFERNCIISGNKKSEYDLYFLHGFTSSKFEQIPIVELFKKDYTTIQCDARGHGTNIEGKKEDWIPTIEDYEKLIEKRNKPSILIGHSMGATEALSIFARNKSKNIKKVFVVAGVNGITILDTVEEQEKFMKKYKYKQNDIGKIKNMIDALPEEQIKDLKNIDKYEINSNKIKLCGSRSKDIYLIHSKNDKLVTFDQFERNKKEFCVPDENVLIYDDLPINDHIVPFYKNETVNFIKKKLKEDK